MDTLPMRIVAASSQLVPGFEPTGFTPLPDPELHRLFITDGDTQLIATLYPPTEALREDTEQVAAALLRTLLPDTDVKFPEVLATLRISGDDWGLAQEHELVLTRPLPGTPLITSAFAQYPELVDSVADFLAALHSGPTAAVADAGLVAQEPLEVRDGLLADLDRAATTGRVPHTLLQRWETVLETAGVWHFLPAPLHGNISVDALRTADGALTAVTDIDQLRVGDPALDLAAVADLLEPDDFSRLLSSYQRARGLDDPHLLTRIGLVSEMSVLQLLLACVDAGDDEGAAEASALLKDLAELETGDSHSRSADQPPAQVQSTDGNEAESGENDTSAIG